jgi:hypothetical protein
MERDFKGVWIPKEIWLDDRLTALEKVILIEVDSLDIEDKHCYASNKHLADFCQCTEVKISNAIRKCIVLGYLEVVSFDGRTRILKSRLKESLRQTQTNVKADLNKIEANNIDNNTDNNLSTDTEVSVVENPQKDIRDKIFPKAEAEKAIELWNSIPSLPNVIKLSDKRKLALKNLLKEYDWGQFEQVIENIRTSSFLNGTSGRWQCSFDWVLNRNNFLKVLEGQYKDREEQTAQRKDYSDVKKEDLEKPWDWGL